MCTTLKQFNNIKKQCNSTMWAIVRREYNAMHLWVKPHL